MALPLFSMGSCSFQPLSKPANANPVQTRRRLGDDVWNIARRALSSTSTAELYAHRSEYFLVQYALFNTSHGHLFLLVRSTTSCRTVDSGAVRSLATLLRSASRLLLFNTLRSVGCNLYASRAAPRAHAIRLYCQVPFWPLRPMPSLFCRLEASSLVCAWVWLSVRCPARVGGCIFPSRTHSAPTVHRRQGRIGL